MKIPNSIIPRHNELVPHRTSLYPFVYPMNGTSKLPPFPLHSKPSSTSHPLPLQTLPGLPTGRRRLALPLDHATSLAHHMGIENIATGHVRCEYGPPNILFRRLGDVASVPDEHAFGADAEGIEDEESIVSFEVVS
jgi:hypothetical protein